MSNNGASLPADQEVVSLVSQYINATDLVNTTFQNRYLSGHFTYIYNVTSPFDWLANPDLYESYQIASSFCDNRNCVNDCQDLNQLFDGCSPAPFGVCLLFSNVSRSLPNRDILSPQQASKLSGFGFSDSSDDRFHLIATTVTTCLTDACDQNPNAKDCTRSCSSQALMINDSTPSFAGVSGCLSQVCSQDLTFADFDLAGIGVTISYFLQIAIAVFGIAYLFLLQKRSKKTGLRNKHQRRWQDRKEEFISSLVEFHKAQCFFVVTVQIAALTMMQKPAETSQANMTAIPVIAAIGVQAPLFVYLAIAKYGRQSGYLLLLTAAAWILSSATMWDAYWILYIAQNLWYQLPPVESCGNNDLSGFCFSLGIYAGLAPDSERLASNLAIWFVAWISVWSLSTLVLFSAVASWIELTRSPKLMLAKAVFNPIRNCSATAKLKRPNCWKVWRYLNPKVDKDAWLFHSLIALLAASLCMEMYQLAYIWTFNLESAGNWRFGQIVAVLVWAAPLTEFLNVTINGIIEGSKFRFARSLTVARVQKSLPVSPCTSVQQQRPRSGGDAGMDLVNPPDDDVFSARWWSKQALQETTPYDLDSGAGASNCPPEMQWPSRA